MTSRRAAGLLFALPLAFPLDRPRSRPRRRNTVREAPRRPNAERHAERADRARGQLRPSTGDETGATGAPPPDEEIAPTAVDEGAGWEAAVEAAQSSTPLIGEEQTKAVERINAYFNNITNLQGSFEQVDATNKQSSGRFYVQRPGKIRFDYAPPSALRIVADGSHLAIEDADLKTVEKYPDRIHAVQTAAFGRGRSFARCPGRGRREPGRDACRDARRQVGRRRRQHQARVPQRPRASAERVEHHRRARPDHAGDRQRRRSRGGKVAADFFTAKEGFQPFR